MVELSVIVPTYKPGDYLWECLNSIAGQTIDNSKFEIIIVLNGCNDPWLSSIKVWAEKNRHCNVNVISTTVPGVSNARNLGLAHAHGRYISFIDDDDYISPSYLEGLIKEAHEDAIVLTDSRAFYDGTDLFIEEYSNHIAFKECKRYSTQSLFKARTLFNGPCMKLIPAGIINGCQFDTALQNGEDSLFMFEISNNIGNLRYASDDAIYYRRIRNGSAITTKRSVSYWLKNSCFLTYKYLLAWSKHPIQYNFIWVISRFLATLKSCYYHISQKDSL